MHFCAKSSTSGRKISKICDSIQKYLVGSYVHSLLNVLCCFVAADVVVGISVLRVVSVLFVFCWYLNIEVCIFLEVTRLGLAPFGYIC